MHGILSPFLFLPFLVNLATTTILQNFSLDICQSTTAGRGLCTTIDRPAGDVLLKIPVSETIRVSANPDESAKWTPEESLALQILQLKDKDNQNDSPSYVSGVFPNSHHGVWTIEKDIFQSLQLPKTYMESLQATRQAANDFVDRASAATSHSEDELRWAWSMVRSRSMAVPELNAPIAILPWLDLCNHDFDAGTALELIQDHWVLTSKHSYKAGDAIHLSYGDDKDDWKLILTYGFASGENNPNHMAFFTWRELLHAAGSVRPAIFSERVQTSLMKHPQLGVYVEATEARATFSFDLKTGTPRESLQTGLALLTSLATQLGFPSDDRLPQEALQQLLRDRMEEIAMCKTKVETDNLLLKSIYQILEREERMLQSLQSSK